MTKYFDSYFIFQSDLANRFLVDTQVKVSKLKDFLRINLAAKEYTFKSITSDILFIKNIGHFLIKKASNFNEHLSIIG